MAQLVLTRLMEAIREKLHPLFIGGCQRFIQQGNDATVLLPCAILRWTEDVTSNESASQGGKRYKSVRCVIELRLWHERDNADPNALLWSDEAAEEQIAKADQALGELNDDATLRAISPDADILDIVWVMGRVQRGDAITKAGLTFLLRYGHSSLDPRVAA